MRAVRVEDVAGGRHARRPCNRGITIIIVMLLLLEVAVVVVEVVVVVVVGSTSPGIRFKTANGSRLCHPICSKLS